MRISVCTSPNVSAPIEFWSTVSGVREVAVIHQISDLSTVIGSDGLHDILAVRLPRADAESAEMLMAVQQVAKGVPVIAWVPESSASEAFSLCYLGADELITDGATLEE